MKSHPTRKSSVLAVGLACAAVLAGCSSAPKDELAGKTAERLYAEARDDIAAGSYERAIKSLERVEGLAAGTLLAQQAQLEVAYLQWKSRERAQALSAIERFIKLHPSSPALDYAMYLRGLANLNDELGLLGRLAGQDPSERDQRATRDAWLAFKELVEQFPDSTYAADARTRMAAIVASLAAYEVHVARYYLRRGAHVAAVNRARQVLEDFRESPSTEEALAILVESYDHLGLEQLRDDALRVLRLNHPSSRFLAAGPSAAARR